MVLRGSDLGCSVVAGGLVTDDTRAFILRILNSLRARVLAKQRDLRLAHKYSPGWPKTAAQVRDTLDKLDRAIDQVQHGV